MQTYLALYFPLLALPILLLLYFSGPLSAAGVTIFSTLIGTVAFIFSAGEVFSSGGLESKLIPFTFLIEMSWLWFVFWTAEKLIEHKELECHRLQEEAEKLELCGLDYQQKTKDAESFCRAHKDRLALYSQLKDFTDELAARLKPDEVREQVEDSVRALFSKGGEVQVRLYLFSFPNSPGENDFAGEWIVRHRIPLLIKDASQDLRFSQPKKSGSLISCPIERENLIVGTLTVESDAPSRWKEEDLRFLSDIANIVSIAMTNASYYEKIESLAVRDSLTGLFVRFRFDERVEEEFARSKVNGSPLSLILFDIDHFKKVNDQWGHLAGDQVLRAVSDLIVNQTRETDFCARYGGEEISVLMPLTTMEHAHRIAERIRKDIEKHAIGPHKIRVTISGGVALVRPEIRRSQDLIAACDRALYAAKESGRNRLVKSE